MKQKHSKVEVTCATCGKIVFKNYSDWKNNKTGKFYCCREHSSIGRRGYKCEIDESLYTTVLCSFCNAPKSILISDYNRSKSKIFFCNDDHMHKWQSENWSGENSPIFGRPLSEEHCRRISEAKKGKHLSEEHKRKIGDAQKGEKSVWFGRKHTEETKRKMSEDRKGKPGHLHTEEHKKRITGEGNPFYGKKHSEETIQRLRESSTGKIPTEETRRRMSLASLGRKLTEEAKLKLSLQRSGEGNPMYGKRGKDSPNWRGGYSSKDYNREFTEELKQEIRKRDGFTCQLCGEPENGIALAVHHIDYDKTNNSKENLVSLHCLDKGCHQKTNGRRAYWTKYFQTLLTEKYGYLYYKPLRNGFRRLRT